jgi:hypothetical protein
MLEFPEKTGNNRSFYGEMQGLPPQDPADNVVIW